MNILIPHTWLLEHLETSATPEQIQKHLSLSGPSVERINTVEGEPVYDIEVTTNRVDCMSVRGIAREAAVILTEAGIPSKLRKLSFDPLANRQSAQDDKLLPLPIIHNDPKLCKRILCQVIADVSRIPSPDWMQKRLRQIGVNVHDSVIDITNYITHDLGHPCHAFDYDTLMKLGGVIRVVAAKPKQLFTIIDGTEYETVGGEVVFENKSGEIIDLPAIKGTKNTSLNANTKNVLFWLEDIDPKKVRFASMTHAIRTVAAQLNEKNVDPNLADAVFAEGIELLTTLANGTLGSEKFDLYPIKRDVPSVRFHISDIERYLGITLPTERIVAILENLECKVERRGSDLDITPPTFRPDLEIGADIVEEVARIYGYHNLPSTLMAGAIPTNKPKDVDFDLEHETKAFLATLGAYEVYTYSMIDRSTATREGGEHVTISNPLTDDMTVLRQSLWSSHIRVLQSNPTKNKVTIFEFANVYLPTKEALPNEQFHLTLTTGDDERKGKGMVEALAKKYFLPTIRYVDQRILAGDTVIGTLIYPEKNILALDIVWKDFLSLVRKYPIYVPESKFTPVTEDLTFTVPSAKSKIGEIMETITAVTGVTAVIFKDQYKHNQTFSLSYNSDHQLDAGEVTAIRGKIITAVESKHSATLVGKIE